MNINDIITESQHTCPHCGGSVVEYSELTEKKDACYYKVKASAKVWPSAYASGRLVQCRKKGAANYGNKSESVAENFADGKGPGRPGDSGRHGIPKNATMAELEKASRSAGRKGQLARWQLNMRRGKAKLSEIKQRLDAKCWPGTRKEGTKIKSGTRVNNCVPVSETGVKTPQLKTYAARVKLKQPGYTNIVDATVMARNPEMARRLLHQLYGGNSSVVGQPREIK
jgi:hypothetical protein